MANREKVISNLKVVYEYLRHFENTAKMGEWVADALALLKEQEEQIKNRDESLEKAREEIKWLRGMLKEQEAVMPNVSSVNQRCGNCNKVIEMDGWKTCPWCGKPIDWARWWRENTNGVRHDGGTD